MAKTNFKHLKGTKVGDKEEVSSIYSVFCEGRKRARNLYVGSVKSNIGHLEASAGIAGLIKSILVLKTGVIPPQLNLIEPKTSLKLGERNITVSCLNYKILRLPTRRYHLDVNRSDNGVTGVLE